MNIYQSFCKETVGSAGNLTDFILHYPSDFNFGYDVVDKYARLCPDKKALVWCSDGSEEHYYSFTEIMRRSNQYANALLAAGIRRGNRVIVVLKRHAEYWFTAVALHKIGAVLVPVTHMLTTEDFSYRIKNARAKAVICTPAEGVPERIRLAASGRRCLLWTVKESAKGFRNLSEEAARASVYLSRKKTKATDPMLMYYTSGTTGNPKGVIHDYTYPLAHIITAKYWQHAEDNGLHFTVAETGWGKASWGKIYGQWLVGSAVMAYDFDSFDPLRLTDIINRFGVTSFCAPPTVYRYLVRKDLPAMPTLRYAATAGEALSPDIYRKFREKTGLTLRTGYGQTETTLLIADFIGDANKEGALGQASPMFHIDLWDRDGRSVPAGETGEIVVMPRAGIRQEGIFSSYLNDHVKTINSWRGGAYHTGDLAFRDADGTYWFKGRRDDIIKTSGYRVGPYEVEKVLMEDEAIAECSVIGIPDRLRGQAIKAYVVLSKGFQPTIILGNQIRTNANSKLAEYKWVRVIEFVKELPKTISGKVRVFELREKLPVQDDYSYTVITEEEEPVKEMP